MQRYVLKKIKKDKRSYITHITKKIQKYEFLENKNRKKCYIIEL